MSCGFPIRKSLAPPFASFFLAGRSGFWYPAPVRRTPFPLFAALFACALFARAAATPLWCGEGAAVFGGGTGGVARIASPAISVTPDGSPVGWWENGVFSVCRHMTAPIPHHWTLLPEACLEWLVPEAYGDAHLSVVDPFLLGLFPAMNGGPSHGGLSFWNFDQTGAHSRLWGPLSAPVASHPCAAGTAALCLSCGRRHGSEESCFHADDCASRTNLASACTCPPPFVRIGDAKSLRLAGEEGCCCAAGGRPPDLLFASPALGASVSNDWIVLAPTDRSPTIGGHSAQYRVFDATGGVHRALTLRATAADLGIEPVPSDAPVPYDWQEGPEAYYVTSGTLCVARRAAPYPIRLWNKSPSDARLVFSFSSPTNGPGLFDPSLVTRRPSLVSTNAAPFSSLNSDATVHLDANCSNALATLSLTLSDPAANRTFLTESLSVQVVDTDPGEHWRVRSATDRLSWDFSDAPANVWVGLGHAGWDGVLTNTIAMSESKTPSFSLDLPPGDYDLEAYFPCVYDGGSMFYAWATNRLHIVHTEVTPSENLRFTNATERACFALTNNNGQAANWTISPVVAGGPTLFSSKTGGAGSAARLDNATSVWVRAGTMPGNYTITATHPYCPASTTNATFTVGRIDVESLLFNWDTTSSTNDAINLRWNYTNEINLVTGEWTRAGYRAPACYVTNAWPIIRATFSAAPADLSSVTLLAETDAAIGGFAVTNVSFSNGAASNVVLSTRSATTNCVLKEAFDLTWKAVVSNEIEIVTNTLGKTDGHVFYTIIGEPKLPWTDSEIANTNVWVSALELLTRADSCAGKTTELNALSMLTRYLFSACGFSYDTSEGMPHYLDFSDNWFLLGNYISSCMSASPSKVNCFDQAHGLSYLAAAIGIDTDILRMEPFGYLNPGHLVGITNLCNNPFYTASWASIHVPLCGTNDTNRTKFKCHFFVRLGTLICDACAGPATGTEDCSDYVSRMVDTSTHDEQFYAVEEQDIFGFWHIRTVEGGVPSNAVPFTDTEGMR